MKKILIVGNWKMNPPTLAEAKRLFNTVEHRTKRMKNAEVVICPPFVFLSFLKTNGAQDCFWEERGAFTGEVSPKMLKSFGVEYVILGHSERRKHKKETDEMIAKKIKAAKRVGLKPILCVDKVAQVPKAAKGLIIAYEPLFAIGTGMPCSPAKAEKMRKQIQKKAKIKNILYGGSVNSQNAKDYIKRAGFNGLLVGGASLNAKEFVRIIKSIDFIA